MMTEDILESRPNETHTNTPTMQSIAPTSGLQGTTIPNYNEIMSMTLESLKVTDAKGRDVIARVALETRYTDANSIAALRSEDVLTNFVRYVMNGVFLTYASRPSDVGEIEQGMKVGFYGHWEKFRQEDPMADWVAAKRIAGRCGVKLRSPLCDLTEELSKYDLFFTFLADEICAVVLASLYHFSETSPIVVGAELDVYLSLHAHHFLRPLGLAYQN